MIPRILELGPAPINSFGLMIALAIFAGIIRLQKSFERNGIPSELAERYVFVGGVVGLLGSRLWYMLERLDEVQQDIWGALLSTAGFTFYGGFILSTIVLIAMSIRDKLGVARFVDSVGPTLTLSYAIGRLGCQLAGDGDYGIATQSIFGMSYAQGVVPTPPGVLSFPTPLYESSMCMLILYVLTKVEVHPRFQAPFMRFGTYLSLLASERFLVEFLRINPKMAFGLSEAQLIAIAIFTIGLILIGRGSSKRGVAV